MSGVSPEPARIVVLDGHALNPGDLSWAGLAALGDLTVHDRTEPGAVLERAAGATVLLTNKVRLDAVTLAALPALRFVAVLATGHDVVDVAVARERGVVVSNVPEYGTDSVAQHTIALLLELASGVGRHAAAVRDGAWLRSVDWCFWDGCPVELAGLVLGVVGYGRIGRRVAGIARALGMTVMIAARPAGPASGAPAAARAAGPGEPAPEVERVPVDQLFARADAVSLHCPATPANRGFVDATLLARMKPTAWLINTARGALVDEAALARALRESRLGGAALDVLAQEPMAADSPLRDAPRLVLTPHLAWASLAARRRLMAVSEENVRRFLAGAPIHLVG